MQGNPPLKWFLAGCSSPSTRLARTPHGASRTVQAMSDAWSVKTLRAPSRHCRDARVYVIRLRPCVIMNTSCMISSTPHHTHPRAFGECDRSGSTSSPATWMFYVFFQPKCTPGIYEVYSFVCSCDSARFSRTARLILSRRFPSPRGAIDRARLPSLRRLVW